MRPQSTGIPDEFSKSQCQSAGETYWAVVPELGAMVELSAVIVVSVGRLLLVVCLIVNESLVGVVGGVLVVSAVVEVMVGLSVVIVDFGSVPVVFHVLTESLLGCVKVLPVTS